MAEQKKTGATVMQTDPQVVSFNSRFNIKMVHILICIKNPLKSNGLL